MPAVPAQGTPPARASTAGPARVILFSQQTVGLGSRKTSMVFLAEALARRGARVSLVTVQLSRLSQLRRGNRVASIPAARRNRWYDADGLHGYVWIAPVHPARFGSDLLNRLTAPLVTGYGRLLPAAVLAEVQRCDLVVIESCAGIALYRALRRMAPEARFVCSMSDRLDAVGMHPALGDVLRADAAGYDLIRTSAQAMAADLPAAANVRFIPHGLDKRQFDAIPALSGMQPATAVLAGDMMLDEDALRAIASGLPSLTVHYYGRTPLGPAAPPPNLVVHGEVPFAALLPAIKQADVGLALYRQEPGLDYLAQSSLKMLQYAYCRLPIVAPRYVAQGVANAHGYDPGDAAGAVAATVRALAAGRTPMAEVPHIRDWDEVAAEMVEHAGFAAVRHHERPATLGRPTMEHAAL